MTLSRQDELALIKRAQQGEAGALEAFLDAFQDLIQRKARKFLGHGLELEDLMQEGQICISRWLDRYLPEKAAPHTYFGQRLEWHFIDYKSAWLGLRDEARRGWPRVKAAIAALRDAKTEEPTLDAIAKQSNVRPEIVAEILAVQRGREVPFQAEDDLSEHGEGDIPDTAQLCAEEQMVQADEFTEQFHPLLEALQGATAPFLVLCILQESDAYQYTWKEIATLLTDATSGPPGWSETLAADYPNLPVSLVEWASVLDYFATPPPECTQAALRQWYRRQKIGLSSAVAARSRDRKNHE